MNNIKLRMSPGIPHDTRLETFDEVHIALDIERGMWVQMVELFPCHQVPQQLKKKKKLL